MASRWAFLALFLSFLLVSISPVIAQSTSSGVIPPATSPPKKGGEATASVVTTPPTTTTNSSPGTKTGTSSSTASSVTTTPLLSDNSTAPDVLLNVPQLSVGRIELDVDNLQADINLNANVASLVMINAGVAVSITKVNITISDVDAQLELIVRLGHLVDIVQRVFQSLDLNPLLITLLNDVTQVVSPRISV
jgi:hypothetical protein